MWWFVAALAAKGVMSASSDVKGAIARNDAAMSQLGKTLNQLNLNYAAQLDRTEQALFNSQIGAEQARSKVELQAAASGTMGASVSDAVSTVNVAEDRQIAGIKRTQDQLNTQYELSANKAIDDTSANMDWESYGDKMFKQVLNVGVQTAAKLGEKAADSAADSDSGGGSSSAPTASNNFNYDLWGNRGSSGVSTGNSWSSYLGGS